MNTKQEIQNVKNGGYVVRINEALEKSESSDRFTTGFITLNEAMREQDEDFGGFRDGDLVVISGKSSHGKTLFAQNLTKNLIDDGVPVLFFTYEVKINNIYKTFLALGCKEAPEIFTPKKNVTGDIGWIEQKIKEADRKFMTKVIVIDHLDFITTETTKDEFRRNEINTIVRRLKTIAVEDSKVIILLAHSVKTRESNLKNDDIADSRQINNLADYIFFVSRDTDSDGVFIGNTGDVKLTKSRHSGKGAKLYYEVDNRTMIEVAPPIKSNSLKI